MHTRLHYSTDTQRRNRQSWWCRTWRLVAVLTLGLALTSPSPGQAKTFQCGAGDVQCLIDAIHEANANGQKNTIRLAAGTYPLTTIDNDTDGPNGLPSITGEIILRGAGVETTSLERVFTGDPCGSFLEPEFRILHVASTGVLTLKGLTLRGGCLTERSSSAGVGGGGLFTRGAVVLIQSAIVQNFTFHNRSGGGIASGGTLMVFDSTIADNEALVGEGGGIISSGTLIVTHSRIADNIAEDVGGIGAGGFTVLEHSSIVENDADGAGLGGIRNAGTMYITASTIAGNTGPRGGGIQNVLSESTLIIDNSTIAENLAQAATAGIHNEGTLTVLNSTIARNTTFRPGSVPKPSAGIGNIPFFIPGAIAGTVILQNTILAQNTFAEPPPSGAGGPDCSGLITSLGTNLIGNPTDCGITLQASDLTGDPGLGDFTDNGTPGNGHVPLLPTSQAIDAGNDAVCPRRDQLGQRRVDIPDVGTSRCDIGAIEFQRQDKHQDNADSNQPDMDNDQPDADLATAAQGTP